MKKTLILVEGRTNAGKDSLVKAVANELNIPIVVSYTDRPKRACEVEGREHYFLSEEQMTYILETEEIAAYTKIENPKTHKKGYRYAVTTELLDSIDGSVIFYIINPNGIKYLKDHVGDKYDMFVVSVMASEEVRRERSLIRGDSEEDFKNRAANENEEFNFFESNLRNYDCKIINEGDIQKNINKLKKFVANELIAKYILDELDC